MSGIVSSNRPARRVPGLVAVAWSVTVVVLAILVISVLRYLGDDHSGDHSQAGGMSMTMSHSASLFRAGSNPSTLGPLLGSRLFTEWQLDAVAIAVVVLLAAGYLTAVALVPIRQAGERWSMRRTASFMAGLGVCLLATNSSIAVYDQVLFSAHMIGHLMLVMLAPVLLMAGRPVTLLTQAARKPDRVLRVARGRVVSLLTCPPVALASYTAVIVGTHLTSLMDTLMRVTWAGQLEHLVFVLVGCQFFSLVVGDEPIRWRLTTPARWFMLAIAMAVDTFTGIILLQSTQPLSMLTSPSLHVNALSDTKTGGAIMWFGGDAIMAVVMVVLVVGWLQRPELRRRDELGWAEQARRATFTAHTGAVAHAPSEVPGAPEGFDDDDDARQAYNAWLANLERRR